MKVFLDLSARNLQFGGDESGNSQLQSLHTPMPHLLYLTHAEIENKTLWTACSLEVLPSVCLSLK